MCSVLPWQARGKPKGVCGFGTSDGKHKKVPNDYQNNLETHFAGRGVYGGPLRTPVAGGHEATFFTPRGARTRTRHRPATALVMTVRADHGRRGLWGKGCRQCKGGGHSLRIPI